jgi:predicted MFS family arabinose efflux permease
MRTTMDPRIPNWRRPDLLLMLMAAAVPLSFATWQTLLNNFAIEQAAFTGAEIGMLQSLREIPGFLAFAVVFVLFVMREQTLAIVSLALLGIGTALTGFFPSVLGLYCTTVVMSLGFHYYETVQSSLALQWIEKARAPETLGRLIAVGSFTGLAAYGLVWFTFRFLDLGYTVTYLAAGGLTCAIALAAWLLFPSVPQRVAQHRRIILRRRYWLYYALTFLSGARRQIFMVFAGFLLVQRFGFGVEDIALLFLLNGILNVVLARRIGRLVGHWGERRALLLEYCGLACVFSAYAFVASPAVAALLYVVDHLFFALAIAIKTYFQKIADPADIAATAAVGFTINHIAAVVIPAAFGLLWLISPAAVFLAGAALAIVSALLSLLVPAQPAPGAETRLAAAAEPV